MILGKRPQYSDMPCSQQPYGSHQRQNWFANRTQQPPDLVSVIWRRILHMLLLLRREFGFISKVFAVPLGPAIGSFMCSNTKSFAAPVCATNARQATDQAVNGGKKSWRLAVEKCSALPGSNFCWSEAGNSQRGVYLILRLC